MAINSLVGIITQFVNLVSRIIITPYVLSYIPLKEYGLWTICFVILSYAGLSAFGVNNSYVKYVAEYQAQQDTDKINELMSTGLICMGSLSVIIYIILAAAIPFFLKQYGVEPSFEQLASTLIIGTALAFLIDIGLGGFKGLLEGLQEIALTSYIFVATGIIEVALIIVLLPLGYGVKGMLYAYIIKTIILVAVLAVFSFIRFKGLKLSFRLFRIEAIKTLFVFGGKIQVLGLMGIFIETFDRVVTTSLLSLEATGLIEIGRKFPNTARGFTGPAFAPFLPAASFLGGWWEDSEWPSIPEKVQKYLRLIILSTIGALAGLLFIFLFKQGWLTIFHVRINYLHSLSIIAILAVFLFFSGWFNYAKNKGEYFVGDEVQSIFLQGTRNINIINFTVYAFLIAISDKLMLAWVGPGYETAVYILIVVALSNMIHQGTGPGTAVFRGINRSGREFEYTIIQFILVLFWIPCMTMVWGVVGAAVGFSLSAITASFYFFLRSIKAFRIPWKEALRVTVLPGLSPLLAACLIRSLIILLPAGSRWLLVIELLILGLIYLLMTGYLLKKWFLSPQELEIFSNQMKKISRKLPWRREQE